ncbi:MAG TPA: hypothetical protein VFV86_10865 [Nitrososphaeraceae archaeon]|nr:hypothetical protein [Nitrososphaeraceae archaeon]
MPTPPVIKFHLFNPALANPSGSRHLQSHGSFIKELGVGAGQYLDFGSKNLKNGKQSSSTYALVAFATDFNDANEAVYNMRFWIPDFSDFTQGTFFFNGFPSGQWIQGIRLTDASGYFVPTSLPSGQNMWRDGGGIFDRTDVAFQELTASGIDGVAGGCQVTMPFYLSITVDTDVPPGVYGGDGGGFRFRLTYDYR